MTRCARIALFLLIPCAWAVVAAPAAAGVVLNTLQGFDDQAPGWSGGLDGLFTGKGGNTESIQLTAGGRIQWRDAGERVRLQLSEDYQESGNAVTDRNLVAHLRHNHRLGARWATVEFVQVQSNSFQQLTSRWLLGAGLRRDFVDRKDRHLAVGVTPMLEVERLSGETGHPGRGRLSVFALARRTLTAGTRVDVVGFWQPLFSDFADQRAVVNAALVVKVTGAVDLKVGTSVEHDSRPPAGVKRTDWSTYTGLGVTF